MKTTLPFLAILVVLVAASAWPGRAEAATLSRPPNNLSLQEYWPLDEGTGTQAMDHSGKNVTGTLSGTVWTAGRHGKALNFDGATSYVQTLPFQSQSAAKTICAWVNPTSVQSGLKGLIIQEQGFYLRLNDMKLEARVYTAGGLTSNTYTSTNTVAASTWSHVCETVDATTGGAIQLTFYINGVLDFTTATNITGPNAGASGLNYLKLGNDDDVAGRFFNGSIDDVRIYNRALTAAQVAALYSQGEIVQKAAPRAGLLGEWLFNEGSGTLVHDTSGHGNNGTIAGTATWIAGKHGKALSFDGSTNIIDMPAPKTLQGLSTFTISVWASTASYGATPLAVAIRNNTSSATLFGLYPYDSNGGNGARIWFDGSSVINQNNGAIADGKFHHFVFVSRSATDQELFVDNQSVGTNVVSKSLPATLSNIDIGAWDTTSGQYYNGALDDVRLYTRTLSAAEITQLYNEHATTINTSSVNLQNGTSLAQGLAGLWTFDGPDVTDKVYDRSGQANNAYAFGFATTSAKTIGKMGQALKFTGATTQYVRASGFTSLGTNNQPYAISAWIRPVTAAATGDIIHVSDGATGVGWCLSMLQMNSGKAMALSYLPGAITATGATSLSANTWYHVVTTWNATDGLRLYVNGALDASTAQATFRGSGASDYVFIGSPATGTACTTDAGTGFAGSIDDVRIYSRSLSAAEIKQLYLMGK